MSSFFLSVARGLPVPQKNIFLWIMIIFRVLNGARVLAKFRPLSPLGGRVGAPGSILVTTLVWKPPRPQKHWKRRPGYPQNQGFLWFIYHCFKEKHYSRKVKKAIIPSCFWSICQAFPEAVESFFGNCNSRSNNSQKSYRNPRNKKCAASRLVV